MRAFRCRCRRKACEARQTLAMHPDDYLRPPRCKSCLSPCPCGQRQNHKKTDRCGPRPGLRVDKYRQRIETKKNVCKCYGYSFPHAYGRGWCEHNNKLTEQHYIDRFSYMGQRAA